ncbi:MAG: permease prefix domain 1-containing protein [Nocardioidaceae bacterium]
MGSHPVLAAYLTELSRLLDGSAPRRRRRITAEIRDHLLSEMEANVADGRPEPEAAAAALSCIGSARGVAAGFAEMRARHAVERAEQLTLASVLAFGALFVVSTQVAAFRDQSALARSLADPLGWIAVQISTVAVVIAWLRVLRLRSSTRASARDLVLTLRAVAVAAGTAGVALGLDLIEALGGASSSRTAPALGTGLAVAGIVAMLALLSVTFAAASVHRLSRVDDSRDAHGRCALEEVRWATTAAAERAEALGQRHGRLVTTAVCAAATTADRTLSWALGRKWHCSAALAAAAGAALAVGSLREHGLAGGPHQALLSIAAAGVLFAAEAGAVVASVYAFDRLLRLWPPNVPIH